MYCFENLALNRIRTKAVIVRLDVYSSKFRNMVKCGFDERCPYVM